MNNQAPLILGTGMPTPVTVDQHGLANRLGLFILFLICGLAIFIFGTNYWRMFPTNGSIAYTAGISAVFLVAAILLKRDERHARYWQIAYAFFVAACVALVSALLAGFNSEILRSLNLTDTMPAGMAVAKLYDALLVAIPIIVLTRLSGMELGAIYLKRGFLKWGLGTGILALVFFLTSALMFSATRYTSPEKLMDVILWGMVFSLGNGFLEELWCRGIFLQKLIPLLGSTGAILLTSTVFSLMHVGQFICPLWLSRSCWRILSSWVWPSVMPC